MTEKHKPEELDTMSNIARELGLSEKQVTRWAESGRDIGFPEPAETLGRYKLYVIEDVKRWHELWSRVNRNWKQKGPVNGSRKDS